MTWTNTDIVPHSATADDDTFNSGLLLQGQTFTFTFSRPGDFAYYCTRHGGMRGLVIVTP